MKVKRQLGLIGKMYLDGEESKWTYIPQGDTTASGSQVQGP